MVINLIDIPSNKRLPKAVDGVVIFSALYLNIMHNAVYHQVFPKKESQLSLYSLSFNNLPQVSHKGEQYSKYG